MNRLRHQKKKCESASLSASNLRESVANVPRSHISVEDVDSALPFVCMCRLSRRPKSPSNFLRTSLRKIYSHLPHNNNNQQNNNNNNNSNNSNSSNNSNNSNGNNVKAHFRFSY